MSNCEFDNFVGPSGKPANFPNGITIGSSSNNAGINDIGVPNTPGFGVGVCPGPLPAGMVGLQGHTDPLSDNYGSYIYSDGSVMYWRPAHWRKFGTGSNGLALNIVSIKPFHYFPDVATANASGYCLPRSFYDGGAIQPGYFRDKYKCSNNGGIASSVKNGNPLSTAADHNPIGALNGAPANAYYGVIAAAKTRGSNFFAATRAMKVDSAFIALAQAQAASSTTWCAWWTATGVSAPRGCNNSALGDANDTSILYLSDGYSNCGKTGSANLFARTTDNGQNSGSCDENGLMWEVTPGLATDDAGTGYYALKTTARMKDVTGGTGGATDLWGAAGLAALYDSLGATYGAALASSTAKYYGSATQVLSEATSGLPWQAAGLGIPLVGGVGGTNLFGSDYFLDYRPAAMCPISGGNFGSGSYAGVWTFALNGVRGASYAYVGFRSALYL